jgi:hypothetical protein
MIVPSNGNVSASHHLCQAAIGKRQDESPQSPVEGFSMDKQIQKALTRPGSGEDHRLRN